MAAHNTITPDFESGVVEESVMVDDVRQVSIGEIDTEPELDPAERDIRGETSTWLQIDCEQRVVEVYQRSTRVEYTQDEFADRNTRRVIDVSLGCRPDAESLEEWLESDDGQRMLAAAIDADEEAVGAGWEKVKGGWFYEPDKDAVVGTLLAEIQSIKETELSTWDAGDWFAMDGCPVEITADTTDTDLCRLAYELAEDARAENAIIDDTVLNYLRDIRDRKREEVESD